jgi:UDP-N-acetylglucosamine acyltransferase
MKIHPTAVIASDAQIAEGVEIGPYVVIGDDVKIGKNTIIGPHTVIDNYTQIGEHCRIFQFCSIGADPQDLKFKGEKTRVIIGDHNTIREFVTIHRGTTADIGMTFIGSRNLIMAYCHIAHNCKLENNIVMSNAAQLAGHIHVEDFAIISGMTGVHQFTRIGAHCFIGAMSGVPQDIPPYTLSSGSRAKLYGLNVIGLERRNFPEKSIKSLKEAYRIIFRSDMLMVEALKKAEAEVEDCPEVRHFINFIRASERGVCR